jgi:hypothetical protein
VPVHRTPQDNPLNAFACTSGMGVAYDAQVRLPRTLSMNDAPTRAIAADVLSYLTRHPDAADTAEGIQRWWLVDGSAYALADVERALERLARAAAIARRRLPDGRVLYAAAVP